VVSRRCQEEKQQSGGGGGKPEKRTFLSMEEAGLVEMSGLSTHERFLCRLTVSMHAVLLAAAQHVFPIITHASCAAILIII
jgi:hypothetical protein